MQNRKWFTALLGMTVAALVLTACAQKTPNAGNNNTEIGGSDSSHGSDNSDEQNDENEELEINWVRFSDPKTEFTFEVPETWNVEDNIGYPEENIFNFQVYDEDGEMQLDYLTRVLPGGEDCPADATQMEISEHDVTPLNLYEGAEAEGLRFAYRIAKLDDDLFIGSVALLSGPENHGGSCVVSNTSNAYGPAVFADVVRINAINPERYDKEFGTLEEAQDFMQTDLYQNLKRIILSLELN